MLVAGDGVGVAGHAGDGAGGDAAIGDEVALVLSVSFDAVRGDELAAVDVGLAVEDRGVDAESAFGEQEVAENDAGNLEAVGEIEDFGDEGEAVADV